VSRRQYNRWAEQDAQQYAQEPAPAPAAPAAAAVAAPAAGGGEQDRISALKDLADLKAQGILTDEEFAAEKARILGQ
jgi:Short C-terminal domain